MKDKLNLFNEIVLNTIEMNVDGHQCSVLFSDNGIQYEKNYYGTIRTPYLPYSEIVSIDFKNDGVLVKYVTNDDFQFGVVEFEGSKEIFVGIKEKLSLV